jgi:hypothetical protein
MFKITEEVTDSGAYIRLKIDPVDVERIALALERIAASLDVFAQKERSERLKGLPDARSNLAYHRRQLAESSPSYEYRYIYKQAIADLLAVWPELADEGE